MTPAGTRKIPQPKEEEVRVRSYRGTRCIDQQKRKTQKMKDAKKYSQIGCRSSEKIRSMKVVLYSHGETGRLDIETLPVSSHESPMESRAKVEPGSGKLAVYTHFPKDPHCDICLKTKITRASCRRRAKTIVSRAEHFGFVNITLQKTRFRSANSTKNSRTGQKIE